MVAGSHQSLAAELALKARPLRAGRHREAATRQAPGQQVGVRWPLRLPARGINKYRADPLPRHPVEDGRPRRGPDDLTAELAQPGHPGRRDHAAEGSRKPHSTRRRGDPTRPPVGQDGIDALAYDQAPRRPADLLRLGRVELDPVRLKAERADAAAGVSSLARQLLMLQPKPLGSMLGLVAGDDPELPEVEPPGGRSQIVVAGDRGELHPEPLGKVDDLLILHRAAGQPISGPRDDRIDASRPNVLQHPLERRSPLAGIGRRIIVGVDINDVPAQPLSERPARRLLPLDAKPVTHPIPADAAVDGGLPGWHARIL
jgi:hypothetical protein